MAQRQEGKQSTDEEEFYLGWGMESLRANLQLANEILRQLVTLSAALLASGVYFLNKDVIPARLIAPVLIFLLISLAISLLGVLPYKAKVDLKSASEIKEHKEKALKSKLCHIRFSALLLILSLVMSAVGVVLKSWLA